jgi:hypothetical protein
MLQVEQEVLGICNVQRQLVHVGSCAAARQSCLPGIVRSLRALEQGVDMQARIAAEVESLSQATGYTDDNFAYGTTPYATWHKVRGIWLHECLGTCALMSHLMPIDCDGDI